MNLASENRELLSDQSRRQRLQTKQGVPDTSLGDLEYDVDMDPYLDHFARFGYKPENMRVVEGDTSFSPRTGIVSIQPEYLASKRVQSHEYRHGGLNLLYGMYKLYSKEPEMEKVLENLYPGVSGFFKRYEDSYDDWSEKFPMDGTAEEKQAYLNTNPTPSEYMMELYDEDGSFNRPAEYYPYSEDVAFFTDNGFGKEVSRYYPQLKKGVDYKEDPYEYQNIEHDGMPTYSGPSVIKNVYKGQMSDTLDLNSAEQLAKRSRFQTYRKSPGPIDKQWSPGVGETEEFNQILAAEEMARDFYEREKRNEYTMKKGYAQGGSVMNQNGSRGRVPRRTTIADQDHMLAYITPAEALMLRRNGGTGEPGPGGIPAYRTYGMSPGEAGARGGGYQGGDTVGSPSGGGSDTLEKQEAAAYFLEQAAAAERAAAQKVIDEAAAAKRRAEAAASTPFISSQDAAEKATNTSLSQGKYTPQEITTHKRNLLGYGYYTPTGVWVTPSIDMQNGGGKGIAGFKFASSGGTDADDPAYGGNGDGYVDRNEFQEGVDSGLIKQGLGAVSNFSGATPLNSGRRPTGIAGFATSGGIIGNMLNIPPMQLREPLNGQYTKEGVQQYTLEQAARAEAASEAAAQMTSSLDDEPGLNYVDPNAVTGDVIKQVAPIGGDTVVPQTNYITGTGIVPSNAFGMQNFNQQPYPQLGMATNLVTPNAFRPALTYAELLAGYTNPYGNKPAGVV